MVEVIGTELPTHHAVIEPVSTFPGTEFFDAETGRLKTRFPRAETEIYEISIQKAREQQAFLAGLRKFENFKTRWWS